MSEFKAKVTSKGQITLPIELRERLGIEPGDRVVFVEQSDGTVSFRAPRGSLADMQGMLAKAAGPVSGAQIEDWIAQARTRSAPTAKRGKR